MVFFNTTRVLSTYVSKHFSNIHFTQGWAPVKFLSTVLNIDPRRTTPTPIESPERELSIGDGLVLRGSMLRKLERN